MMDLDRQMICRFLIDAIEKEPDFEKKNELLLDHIDMAPIETANPFLLQLIESFSAQERTVLYQIIFLDIGERIVPRSFWDIERNESIYHVKQCIQSFIKVDRFYREIGGLLGYYLAIVERSLIDTEKNSFLNGIDEPSFSTTHLSPPLYDCRKESEEFWSYLYHGLISLPFCAELYVIGGAGDRFNLIDKVTKEPKPVASLSLFDKSLLQWLFDDLDGREYLYYQVTGKRTEVPVILMTSDEKNNDNEIASLCDQKQWFHRDTKKNLFRITQPLVPLIDTSGDFITNGFFQPLLKPGGHGVIWKLAKEYGLYDWLLEKKISSMVVRQINNPISGMDGALCSLLGQGRLQKRSFGFASCPMKKGFHEGLNLLEKREREGGIPQWFFSNIEYVAFATLKKSNPELFSGECPANVNLLFADVESIKEATDQLPFPGLIVNYKNKFEKLFQDGRKECIQAARLESTMQNISDVFSVTSREKPSSEEIPVFIQLHKREKILSATKKSFDGTHFYETPLSFLYDWGISTRELLEDYCQALLPKKRISIEEFIEKGPEFYFFFHPSLGPLWTIIGQKIRRIIYTEGSFVRIGIPQVYVEELYIDGSCSIDLSAPFREVVYSSQMPKLFCKNVTIRNNEKPLFSRNGVDFEFNRRGFHINLLGRSEVWMEDVTIEGEFDLVVPDGMRAIIVGDLQAREGYNIRWEKIEESGSLYKWAQKLFWERGGTPKLSIERFSKV